MKKVIIFAGNNSQASDFISTHRWLTHLNAEYCCSNEKLREIIESVGGSMFVLAGEYWLNPSYRSHEHSILLESGRLKELKSEKEICEYLGYQYTLEDLGIIIQDSIDSKDKII